MIPLIFITDCSKDLQSFFWKGEGYIIFRSQGSWTMMLDQCSHLHIPLSTGWLEDGCVVCPWHQWKFNGAGDCVWPPPAAKEKVPVFSCVEDKGVLWSESPHNRNHWKTVLLDKHWQEVEKDLEGLKEKTAGVLLWVVIGLGGQTRIWCGSQSDIDFTGIRTVYDWVEL